MEALHYKLYMFETPIDGTTIVLCDNEAVVLNTTHSESTIKCIHKSIAYHQLRKAQAAGFVRVGFMWSMENLAGMLTKL